MNGSSPNTDAKSQRDTRVQEVRQLLAADGTLKARAVANHFGDIGYQTAWEYLREAKAVQS